jgi:hypothetical protein
MNREDLEHIIRAAGEVTGEYEFIIVGSQAILGPVPYPPDVFKFSAEADIYPRGAEDKSELIEGALGEGSQFHTTYGYYAQGVDSTTAKLPLGWEGRLHRVQSDGGTHGRLGLCLASSTCSWRRPRQTGRRTVSSIWLCCSTAW